MIVARRHDLLRVRPEKLRPALAATRMDADLADLWVARGWPVVRRRRCAGDPAGCVPVGVPLPLAHDKARLAFSVAPADLIDRQRMPLLVEARVAAPEVWQPTIAALLDLAATHGIAVRVFGSIAWQDLTGLAYVDAGSDLDLIWPLGAGTEALLVALAGIEARAPGALDGEVVRDDGAAVNWRELARGDDPILVKHGDDVGLVARHDLLAPAHA